MSTIGKWLGVWARIILLLVPKADLGLLFVLSQTDSWLVWLKKFGRWGFCRPKIRLSGNIQCSWWEDFWVGYTWPRNKLGNLLSKWSWPVRTDKVCNCIYM